MKTAPPPPLLLAALLATALVCAPCRAQTLPASPSILVPDAPGAAALTSTTAATTAAPTSSTSLLADCTGTVGFGCSPMISASTPPQIAQEAPPPPPARPLTALVTQPLKRAWHWAQDVGHQIGDRLGLSRSPQPASTAPPTPFGPDATSATQESLTARWKPAPLMPWQQPSLAAGRAAPSILEEPPDPARALPGANVTFSVGDGSPAPSATRRHADWLSRTPTLQQQRRRLQMDQLRLQDSTQLNLGLRLNF